MADNPQPTNTRSRKWCYTLNNYTPDDEASIQAWTGVRASIYGREVGENGTPHLQGAVCFENKKSFNQVRALLERAHWEKVRSRGSEAWDYCKKDGNVWEFGS